MKYYFTLQNICLSLFLFLFFSGCSKEEVQGTNEQIVVQISTIDALLQGVFDGETTLNKLTSSGDFGIGTFNSLDGEMLFYNGTFYQIKGDGKIYKPAGDTKTPFSTITYFAPEVNYNLNSFSYEELKNTIDTLIASPNLFYAIRLQGNFNYVKTRSVPAQQKPYPPLVEVTANQPEFEIQSVSGTLCGYYCPPFVTGINVPGYHLHFISEDETFGGHVLEFELDEGTLDLDQITNFKLILPGEGEFLNTDLNADLSGDLEEVEGS
ncbi:acetolactate decarboxylase [Maribellus comscasis]|uniref:Alpha-acetolactate decarboxylase n=1 Tax=Maribellus comscasis TaxID=2681766 RepID=A0A6I6JWX7_9BACT|nr:acetolactate decarboxylase [Maribellus comscasis]QGY43633.1 acetolactate decarboxylase [Maribellus comscasis]